MPTATYDDFIARYPEATAPRATVEAFIEDAAAEIAARCESRGTTYNALACSREALVRKIECNAAYRLCGRPSVGGVGQNDVQSFSQSVGDHSWSYTYPSGNGNTCLLEADYKALGLSGQQIGWLGIPQGDSTND